MEESYRDKLIDERFARDKERICNHEEHMEKQDKQINDLEKLTIEMGELIKKHDERLVDHGKRLRVIEEKPGKNWSAIQTTAISAITSGLVAGIMALILK